MSPELMPATVHTLQPIARALWLACMLASVSATALASPTEADPATAQADADLPGPDYWAGKVTVFGYRRVPIIGKVQFQTSNDVIASVVRRGDDLVIDQQVCNVNFDKVFGAKLAMDPRVPQRMDRAKPLFKRQSDGTYHAGDWTSGWNKDDRDADGHPGITIDVRAPLCGGDLYMESRAISTARAVEWHGALAGEITVVVKQIVLGTRGTCLRLMTSDHVQELPGYIAYEPLPGPMTCNELQDHKWPDYSADPPTLPPIQSPLKTKSIPQ